MVDRILVIDGSATSRTVSRTRLAAACYQPILAATGDEGVALARTAAPGLILLDGGADVMAQLRADPRTRAIPVIATGPDVAALRFAMLRAGADDYLPRPLDDALVLARIRALLRARTSDDPALAPGLAEEAEAFETPAVIGIVAERAELAARWSAQLAGGRQRCIVMTREDALSEDRRPPDVYLVDGDLGGAGAGLRFLSDIRARMTTRNVPVCLVQPRYAPDAAAMAFDLGANDVVAARFDPAELHLRLNALARQKKRLDHRRASVENGLRMAMTDPLTGLYNRRFALPQLDAMAEHAARQVSDMAVLVVDLDRFKSVNDRHGHAAGDAVLVEVARRLACNLRPSDLLARIGGEEFLIALPDLHLADARAIADRLCAAMHDTPFHLPSGEPLDLTISIGLATRGCRGSEPVAETIERADRALLAAKTAGRNQVTVGACPIARGQTPFAGPARLQ